MTNHISDLAARVRPSIVGVVSPTGRGSGYCALPNGLIVTSLDVVGYEREVQITLDDGAAVQAVVARVNVALDVALLIPSQPLGLPHLEVGAEARIGDPTLMLGRLGAEPLLLVPHVTSTGRSGEGFGHISLDWTPDENMRGAPVIDMNGGVLGLVVRPRRSRTQGSRNAHRWLHGLVLPTVAYEGGLMEDPAEELLELVPEYGCPRCDTIFEAEMDRCLECGTLLPHRWLRQDPVETPPVLQGLFAVRAALASVGIPANRARVGPRTWRFSPSLEGQEANTQLDLSTDSGGDHIVLRAPVVRLPNDGFEFVYRHLLTLNDETSGPYRFSVVESTVYLSLFEPILSVDTATFPTTVTDFARAVGQYRSALNRYFSLEPAHEHETD